MKTKDTLFYILTFLICSSLMLLVLMKLPEADWLLIAIAALGPYLVLCQRPHIRLQEAGLKEKNQGRGWYWFFCLSAFVLVTVSLVLWDAYRWTQVNKLPWQYSLKRPLWQLGYSPLPKLVNIPAGEFQMGSEKGSDDEKPVRTVPIKQGFQMGQYEVTFEQFDHYLWQMRRLGMHKSADKEKQNPGYTYPSDEGWGRNNRPVINIDHQQAQDYSQWLSKQTGLSCRLPSEAEWEYAARAGSKTKYSWGDQPPSCVQTSKQGASFGRHTSELFDYCLNAEQKKANKNLGTLPVGTFRSSKNGWDLFDVHGNVWEWTLDCWHEYYKGAPKDSQAWLIEGDCKSAVVRGGSWLNGPVNLRSAGRFDYPRVVRDYDIGFRVLCAPPSTEF